MIGPGAGARVMVATRPVDFRKGPDALAALVGAEYGGDPYSGVIYVFRAKRADRIKLVWWDGTGLCLMAKKLESGGFKWPGIQDGVMRLTAAQLGGDRRCGRQFVELAAHMCPAEREADLLPSPGERRVAAIAIDLQDPGEVAEVRLCLLAFAVGGIDIGDHRRISAAPWAIIASISPELPGLGPPASRIEHRRRRLVSEQSFRSS